jgi:hypothetical protein
MVSHSGVAALESVDASRDILAQAISRQTIQMGRNHVGAVIMVLRN